VNAVTLSSVDNLCSGRVVSNWGMGNPDPAAVRKHWQLFRKQVKLGL
jgi:hypothetical protein